MHKLIKVFFPLISSLFASFVINAGDNHDHHHHHDNAHGGHHRHHEAHVHNEAKLSFAGSVDELLIEFESPAVNFFGFEHAPQTDAEKAKVKNTTAELNRVDTVLSLSGGECEIKELEVEHELGEGEHHHHHSHDEDSHSDVEIEYHFACQSVGDIDRMKLDVFEHFNHFEKITVVWVLDDKQGRKVLTADYPELHFH